jgi:hypothetical protein
LTFAAGLGALITGNVINKRQEQQIRQFDSDLTEAKTELGKQQERAANADARVAGLEQDVANAKTEMAKQQARAATAERAVLELKEKVKSRHLSTDDAGEIKTSLLAAPSGSLDIQISLGAEDGNPFCKELAMAISAGGWTVRWGAQTLMYGQIRGTALIMKDVKFPPRGTATLQNALKSANIDAPAHSDPNLEKDKLILLIAPKER